MKRKTPDQDIFIKVRSLVTNFVLSANPSSLNFSGPVDIAVDLPITFRGELCHADPLQKAGNVAVHEGEKLFDAFFVEFLNPLMQVFAAVSELLRAGHKLRHVTVQLRGSVAQLLCALGEAVNTAGKLRCAAGEIGGTV